MTNGIPSKFKWLVTFILAGSLLMLALGGGNWGTSYSASASVNVPPIIDSINPSAVAAGSPNTTMIISGSNFGNTIDTRVWITGTGLEDILTPAAVIQDGMSVVISDTLLVFPNLYIIRVIKSVSGGSPTIPTIPNPPDTEISNPVPFVVFEAKYFYLPILSK
jgi:hypothetical protein